MPPKKFKDLNSFLDDQPKDPNLVASPFGGYFKNPAADAGSNNASKKSSYQQQRNWKQGATTNKVVTNRITVITTITTTTTTTTIITTTITIINTMARAIKNLLTNNRL